MTNAEWRHLKNRVSDIRKQIAADERRQAQRVLRELAPVVARDREWLKRMQDAAEFHEACAQALRKLVDAHFASRPKSTPYA